MSHTVASPVRVAPVVDVDRVARAAYVQDYYARMQARRL